MVFPPSYVLWRTRTGTCRVFVNILLREIPWGNWVVSYVVGKVFLRGLQRRWNREKRFSIHGEITETSWAVWILRRETTLASCLGLLADRETAYGYLGRLRRLCKKGSGSLHRILMWRYRKSQVMIRLHLVSLISLFPPYGFRSNPVPTERSFR